MPPVKLVLSKFEKIRKDNRVIYIVSSMVFFWAIFDGIMSYLVPILITDSGFSTTSMGFILASSSLAGAIFDFILSRTFANASYRRLFLFVYLLGAIFPLSLLVSKGVVFFVISMVIWGIYYDLMTFANFDLVQKHSDKNEHCFKSGIIMVFMSLGGLIAPIIAGILIIDSISIIPFGYSLFFLSISFVFFLCLLKLTKNSSIHQVTRNQKRRSFLDEVKVWIKVDTVLFPVIIFSILLEVQEAFFWTIGPLTSKIFFQFADFGGLFMAAYSLPFLITGWFVEKITSRFGKKRTAYYSLLFSSFSLFFIFVFHQPIFILAIVLVSAVFVSIAQVAIKGAFVDYVSESHNVEKEIEGSSDLSSNLGYILGPAIAGVIADSVGVLPAFSVMALVSVIIVAFLFVITPKHINVKVVV